MEVVVPMTNEKLTPGRLERIRQNHSAGDHYAELGQADIGLLLGEIERLLNDCQEMTCGDPKFVTSDILRRELTGDPPGGQYAAVLKEAERGEAVNTLDLIDALWWRLRNQRREIARLMKERDTARRSLELTQAQQRQAAIEIERLSEGHENIQRINDNGAKEIERLRGKLNFANREPPHCPSCNCGSSEPGASHYCIDCNEAHDPRTCGALKSGAAHWSERPCGCQQGESCRKCF